MLFHHLLDRSPVVVLHLVEFVNAAHPHVGQHKCACFQLELLRVLVPDHSRSKSHVAGTFARGLDGAGEDACHRLENL